MRAQLVPVDGGAPIEVIKDLTLVGRKEDCDLRLDHKSVSKLHCIIVKTDGLLLLRDLGSTNGTRVNGQRVRRAALLPNDKLTIATFKYTVLFGAPLLDAPAPDEATQHLAKEELAKLSKPAAPAEPEPEPELEPAPESLSANVLPDVYPEEEQKESV